MSTSEAVPALLARPSSALRPATKGGGPHRHRFAMSTLEAVPALPARPSSALRPATEGGGPEGKLRGRPPPPVEPRSGPWRRTGSESGAGRARTRHPLSIWAHGCVRDDHSRRKLDAREALEPLQSPVRRRLRRRPLAMLRELAQRERRVPTTQVGDLLQRRRQRLQRAGAPQLVDRLQLLMSGVARADEIRV